MASSLSSSNTPYSAVATPVDEHVVSQVVQSIPEAQGLTWNDTFFDREDPLTSGEVIAVFDFDYEAMVDFQTKVGFASQVPIVGCVTGYSLMVTAPTTTAVGMILATALGLSLYCISLTPCLLKQNIEWKSYATHVAITRDGIRFVVDKHKSSYGLSICDKGKHSKTVPFDKITDCDIIEPAGSTCCCIPNVLMTVNVDTASSGSGGKPHELRITGLKEPKKFKALVWAMKRSKGSFSGYQAPPITMEMVDRGKAVPEEGVAGLLKDIRNELRQNNELLRSMKGQTASQETTHNSGDGGVFS